MRCTTVSRRAGISLVEVVIVLVMVLIVVGIAAVAMRGWWDNAHQLRCMEHLEKISKAIVLHQEHKKGLPASRLAEGYATWAVQLAPYLPEGSVVGALPKWDLAQSYYAQTEEVRRAQVHYFYCPARRYPPQLSVVGDEQAGMHYAGALGDYAASAGDGSTDWKTTTANGAIIPAEVVKMEDDRLLKWNLLTRLGDLPRGDSPTILAGEKHVPWGKFGHAAAGDGSLYNGDHAASFSRIGGLKFGLAQSIHDPFNDNFGSYHPGVSLFLMADGSVQTFANTIGEEVLGKLTNRNP